jgi:hypothetical protein
MNKKTRAKLAEKKKLDGITVELSMTEVAAIAQRALAEKVCGRPWEVFSGLWRRLERELERAA